MKSRVASLLFAFVFTALPASAQGLPGSIPGSGAIQALTDQLAALTARVSKLEGNIETPDLFGTYTFSVINTGLDASPAAIQTSATMVTLTLNPDGTLSGSLISCGGARLFLGSGVVNPDTGDCEEEDNADPHWTYADGIVTLSFEPGENLPIRLAAGGRFGIGAFGGTHTQGSENFLMILSRLR